MSWTKLTSSWTNVNKSRALARTSLDTAYFSCAQWLWLLFPSASKRSGRCNTGLANMRLNIRCSFAWKQIKCETQKTSWCASFKTGCKMTLQGHRRSLISAPTEINGYWTSIVTLVLFCRVSEILELLYTEKHFFQILEAITAKLALSATKL